MSEVILIGCVSQKLSFPARARDLYVSPLFVKRRRYAEASWKPWAILSALHGLVLPATILAPYDLALASLPAPERRAWGERVRAQLDGWQPDLARVEIHAGRAYVDAVGPIGGAEIITPLAGLSLGRQLAWYINR